MKSTRVNKPGKCTEAFISVSINVTKKTIISKRMFVVTPCKFVCRYYKCVIANTTADNSSKDSIALLIESIVGKTD